MLRLSVGVPGSRRVVLVVTVVVLLAGAGVDVAVRWAARAGWGAAATTTAAVVLAAAAVVPGASLVSWRADMAAGRPALPIDWPFPLDPGGTQSSTLARLDADLRAGRLTPAQVGDRWGGTRTLAVLFMLAQRAGLPPPLRPDQILDYYRTSPDCPPLDGAACG